MNREHVTKSQFKARALEYFQKVEASGEPVVITDHGQLSVSAKAAIEHEQQQEDGIILVSSITAWEIALLVGRDRLTLGMNLDDWLDTVAAVLRR